jgi:glycerol transport system ATP-binding protein
MASIELKDLSHSYGSGLFKIKKKKAPTDENGFAIENLNIRWEHGSANALLGPSGCGKTTLLNVISGLIRPTGGQVLFDGKDVTRQSAQERHIAQVFQFPVIYDSMDVYGNLAFPLRNDGWKEAEIKERVREIAATLELDDFLHHSVAKLTPAKKQKIALGRGLVRPKTAAVLLDEPLTVIDPKQQWDLRRKLRVVQRQLKLTMIYVTHDQHEALTFADQVTVMSGGRISQTGTPEELHSDPASPFVGFFIGSPGMNILDCAFKGEELDFGVFRLPVSAALRGKLSAHAGPFKFGIRPEAVAVSLERREGWHTAQLLTVEETGAYKILTLEIGSLRLKARVPELMAAWEGTQVWLSFPEAFAKVFKDERRIDK